MDRFAIAREQALANERARVAAIVRKQRSDAEVADAIGTGGGRTVFRTGATSFRLQPSIARKHGAIVGATGSGKSVALQEMVVSAIDTALSDASPIAPPPRRLGIEVFFVDIKDDLPRFARSLAALYLRATREIQQRLRGSVLLIDWQPGRVAAQPLLVPRDGVSNAYLATLLADVITVTSEDGYSDSMRLLLVQLLRLFLDLGFPLDIAAATAVLTLKPYRLRLIENPRVPRDLRDYFGNLEQVAAPQTISAFLRRLTALMSFPELASSMCLPPSAAPSPRPITLANCGTRSLLPRSLGIARAVFMIIQLVLDAGRRDPSVPLIAVVEEMLSLLRNAPAVLPWVLDAMRLLRASNTALWWAAQSWDGVPGSAIEEMKNNLGWLLAFQSRSDVAETLFPHVQVSARDLRSEAERRREFARNLESLPPKHAYLWVKSQPALPVVTLDAPEPSIAAGRSNAHLDEVVEILSEGSTLSIDSANRIIEAWRAEHLPSATSRGADGARGLRDLFDDGGLA